MPFGSDATGKGQSLPLLLLRKPCLSRVFIQQRHIVPHDVARRETCKTHCHGLCGTSVVLTGTHWYLYARLVHNRFHKIQPQWPWPYGHIAMYLSVETASTGLPYRWSFSLLD